MLFHPTPIEIAGLRRDALNHRDLGDGVEVIVLLSMPGEKIRVFDAVCPHMGGPLGKGLLCARNGTLECPWHGYRYDLESGLLAENPNEKIWAALRVPSAHFVPENVPGYRLAALEHKREGDRLYVRRKEGAP